MIISFHHVNSWWTSDGDDGGAIMHEDFIRLLSMIFNNFFRKLAQLKEILSEEILVENKSFKSFGIIIVVVYCSIKTSLATWNKVILPYFLV